MSGVTAKDVCAGNNVTSSISFNGRNIVAGQNVFADVGESGGFGAASIKAGGRVSNGGDASSYVGDVEAGDNFEMFSAMGDVRTGNVKAHNTIFMSSSSLTDGDIHTGNLTAGRYVSIGSGHSAVIGNITAKDDVIVSAPKDIKIGNISTPEEINIGGNWPYSQYEYPDLTDNIKLGNLSAGKIIRVYAGKTISMGNVSTKDSLISRSFNKR